VKIVPVIDLKEGCVVRGIGGRREEYLPVRSRLAEDSQPATVGRAFLRLGLDEAYVADLDAIAGRDPSWPIYESLLELGLRLWIDAGVGDMARASAMERFVRRSTAVGSVVVGLETLASADLLPELVSRFGPEHAIFSLDLTAGAAMGKLPAIVRLPPVEIAAWAWQAGVRRIMVLDLARVGGQAGPGTEALCREIRSQCPAVRLAAGGGVRGLDDLRQLAASGCSAVLIGSALHDGSLGLSQLAVAAKYVSEPHSGH
jgi:phosphoribosylformimino-5-aminoimidazole carboxamide ribotide isomerase